MPIIVAKLAGYRRITLNRPERWNALTVEMAAARAAALDDAEADKTCRAILLTGAGRGFCAGQDLTEIVGASPADLDRLLAHYHPLILKIRALPIPVVCAVNGVAAGAGANLAPLPGCRRRALCRPSPASAWSRIAAALGFCRASSARPAPARSLSSPSRCRPRPQLNGASSGAWWQTIGCCPKPKRLPPASPARPAPPSR